MNRQNSDTTPSLYSSCLNATYSYYITSAINTDSQQLEVDFFDIMGGVFGDLDNKIISLLQ